MISTSCQMLMRMERMRMTQKTHTHTEDCDAGFSQSHYRVILCSSAHRFPRNALCVCLSNLRERGRGRGSSYYGVKGLYTGGRTILSTSHSKGLLDWSISCRRENGRNTDERKNESCKAKIQLRPHKSLSAQRWRARAHAYTHARVRFTIQAASVLSLAFATFPPGALIKEINETIT